MARLNPFDPPPVKPIRVPADRASIPLVRLETDDTTVDQIDVGYPYPGMQRVTMPGPRHRRITLLVDDEGAAAVHALVARLDLERRRQRGEVGPAEAFFGRPT